MNQQDAVVSSGAQCRANGDGAKFCRVIQAMHEDDLTSGCLLALMHLSFAEQRIAAASLPTLQAVRRPSPHASLSAKTVLAEAVLRAHGPEVLLRVGQSVPRLALDPIGSALLAARSGRDLMQRWLRFERYVHTRHPLSICFPTQCSATFTHPGSSDDPPSDAINLVLAGLFCGLLKSIGCRAVTLVLGDGERRWAIPTLNDAGSGADRMLSIPPGIDTRAWTIHWRERRRDTPPARSPHLPCELKSAPRLCERFQSLIEADLLTRWTLSDLAPRLMVSRRTLQRRLSVEGKSLRTAVLDARIRRATELLLSSSADLRAISFHCGFADAAHFTRAFKSRAGMTPSDFRQASAAKHQQRIGAAAR